MDEGEDSGTQKFNSPQVKSIGCLLRCLRAVGRYWEEELEQEEEEVEEEEMRGGGGRLLQLYSGGIASP